MLKKVIYIAEDYELQQKLYAALLDKHYNLLFAKNGKELIEIIEKYGNPNLVILDVGMPVMDGRETLAELKKKRSFKGVPVVLISGEYDLDAIQRKYKRMVIEVVRKPFDIMRFEEMIFKHLTP